MKYDNEFLSITGFNGVNIKKINCNIPLIFKNISNQYLINNSLYIVPCTNKLDFNNYIQLKLILEKTNQFNRVYIYIPNAFKEYEQTFKKSKINYISYKGIEHYYFTNARFVPSVDQNIEIKYTKSTQIIFKYFILNNIKSATVREISAETGLSISTISVSLFSLYKMGALDLRGSNTSTTYTMKNKIKAFEHLSEYFINPIKSTCYMLLDDKEKKKLLKNYSISGDSAIERYTDLSNNNESIQIAISSDIYENALDNIKCDDNGQFLCETQKFIYNPKIFSKDNFIDKFDAFLLLFFKKDKDSREEDAMKILKKELLNG